MEASAINNLDLILECLYVAHKTMHDDVKFYETNRKDLKTSQEILSWIKENKSTEIESQDLNLMLFHLSNEEKYILQDYKMYDNKQDNVPSFRILFTGKLLIESGGYTSKIKKDIILINLQFLQTWLIAVGTVFAAIGTICLWIWEVRKVYPLFPEFWLY